MVSIAPNRASTSPGGIESPASGSETKRPKSLTSAITVGAPAFIASSKTVGRPSNLEGRRTAFAFSNNHRFSLSSTRPSLWIEVGCFAFAIRWSNHSLSSPDPAIARCAFGGSDSQYLSHASMRTSRPFCSLNRPTNTMIGCWSASLGSRVGRAASSATGSNPFGRMSIGSLTPLCLR